LKVKLRKSGLESKAKDAEGKEGLERKSQKSAQGLERKARKEKYAWKDPA